MFVTNKALYFGDGKQVHIVKDVPGGKHRIFALDNGFVYKNLNEESLYKISIDTSFARPVFMVEYVDGKWTSNKVANTEGELEFVAIEDNGVIWAGITTQEL